MDIVESGRGLLLQFAHMRPIAEFLFIFSTALVVVIGIIALFETVVYVSNEESTQFAHKKALVILLYSVIFMSSGFFWLNIAWQNITGQIMFIDIPLDVSYCAVFLCR